MDSDLACNNVDSAIIDIRDIELTAKSYEEMLTRLDTTWIALYAKTTSGGSLWVLAKNYYDGVTHELLPFAHDVTQRIRASGFRLKNVLAVYRELPMTGNEKPLACGHFLIPFFVKSIHDYYFDKDSVREPHVFKGIEWGKRKTGKSGYGKNEKRRYSRKGRDPGNVIYEATRDKDGSILMIDTVTDEEILRKLVKVSTAKGGTIVSNISNLAFNSLVGGLERRLTELVLEL